MKKLIASALAGVAIAAPMALASATPATAAPYKNCTQARSNNDCNILKGTDKYGPWLDRDGDGIGCEC